jgi:hypothetical protein
VPKTDLKRSYPSSTDDNHDTQSDDSAESSNSIGHDSFCISLSLHENSKGGRAFC